MLVTTLLLAPLIWSWIPVLTCVHTTLPVAGPQPQPCEPFERRPWIYPELVAYLEQNRQRAPYMAASHDMGVTMLGILATGEPWMSIGGYRGSDPILTVDEFADHVAQGNVRFYVPLADDDGDPAQAAIRRWVAKHCPRQELPVGEGTQIVYGPCATCEE